MLVIKLLENFALRVLGGRGGLEFSEMGRLPKMGVLAPLQTMRGLRFLCFLIITAFRSYISVD